MSKISPKLQKLLVGGTILNNLDRLVDVLEGVKARQHPQVQKPQIFFLQHSVQLDDV